MLSQLLFNLCTAWPRIVARAANRVRNALVARHDPDVRMVLDGRVLVVPLSHDLAWIRMWHPLYTDNLRRVAEFLRARDGAVRLIDVGANVGDSYVLTRPAGGDTALLIEGAERFFRLLERNVGRDPGVTCVHALLSETAGAPAASMAIDAGNARVAEGAANAGAGFDTLDAVLARLANVPAPNLVKVDVEGWDGRVLRGAARTLASAAPVLFFEHHPRLIAEAGDDDRRLFADLAALGYGRMLVYDNRGWLLGTLDPADSGRVAELVRIARERDGYYYDVLAFPERRAPDRDAFLAEERAFYEKRGHRPGA
jgi:FkbM family methyltransferase